MRTVPFWILMAAFVVTTGGNGGVAFGQTKPAKVAPAGAQSAQDGDKQRQQRARALFQQAEEHKQRGDKLVARGQSEQAMEAYGLAAQGYLDAFKFYQHSAFIYNLAQMRRLRGELRWAIRAYEEYLKRDPEGQRAADARQFIAALQAELEKSDQDPNTDPAAMSEIDSAISAVDKKAGADAISGGAVSLDGAADSAANQAVVPELGGDGRGVELSDSGDQTPGSGLRMAGLATASAGVVSLGLGFWFGNSAREAADAVSDNRSMWTDADLKLIEDGRVAQNNQIIALSVGGAALVAGGVLYYLGYRAGESNSAVAVLPSATGMSVLVSGQW